MTFLIVPAPDGTSWTEAYFPGMSPLHLGVVAKSWAEHLLDWCQTQGATAVKILDHFLGNPRMSGLIWVRIDPAQRDHAVDTHFPAFCKSRTHIRDPNSWRSFYCTRICKNLQGLNLFITVV